LTLSSGRINLNDGNAIALDATAANTQGHFNKLSFVANRTQKVSDAVSIYVNLNGQVSSKNLDASEKMELGGMYGVRAYPEGESFADQGYVLTLEARYQLHQMSCNLPSQLQLLAFIDTGVVQFNHTPWMVGDNRRTLSGVGVGVNWTQSQNFMVRAYYAEKLGHEPAKSAPDSRGRFWVQGVKYF
jgi:hemolysin activation/secretion protein